MRKHLHTLLSKTMQACVQFNASYECVPPPPSVVYSALQVLYGNKRGWPPVCVNDLVGKSLHIMPFESCVKWARWHAPAVMTRICTRISQCLFFTRIEAHYWRVVLFQDHSFCFKEPDGTAFAKTFAWKWATSDDDAAKRVPLPSGTFDLMF